MGTVIVNKLFNKIRLLLNLLDVPSGKKLVTLISVFLQVRTTIFLQLFDSSRKYFFSEVKIPFLNIKE